MVFASTFGYASFLLGALFIFRYLFRFLTFFYNYFLKKSTLMSYKRQNSWAVITGATDGIGKAFTIELAKKGFNVLLVSRTEERLKNVIQNDLKDMTVESSYVAIDFSKATNDDYKRLSSALEGKDIAVLINNVGASYNYPEFYTDLSEDDIQHLVKLNIESTNRVTKAVLPTMVNQKRGLVISISSGSSLGDACPLLSVYAATKAYINNWSLGLSYENRKNNIRFEVLTPFYVTTKLSKIRRESILEPNPTKYARSALETVGSYTMRCGYFPHEIIAFVLKSVPTTVALGYVFKLHSKIRKRYFAKHNKSK